MQKLLIAVAAAAFAAPAFAQGPAYDERYDDISRAIPSPEEVEAMGPALDRSVGALMNVDVGPILDAVDPWARRPGYGRPGRTVAELAGRDDPYFEARIRSSIYGATTGMSRMMGAFAAAAPALAQSIEQVERAMDMAIEDYHRRRDAAPRPWREPGPYPDD
jgi:hypothetical protein